MSGSIVSGRGGLALRFAARASGVVWARLPRNVMMASATPARELPRPFTPPPFHAYTNIHTPAPHRIALLRATCDSSIWALRPEYRNAIRTDLHVWELTATWPRKSVGLAAAVHHMAAQRTGTPWGCSPTNLHTAPYPSPRGTPIRQFIAVATGRPPCVARSRRCGGVLAVHAKRAIRSPNLARSVTSSQQLGR